MLMTPDQPRTTSDLTLSIINQVCTNGSFRVGSVLIREPSIHFATIPSLCVPIPTVNLRSALLFQDDE